MAKQTPEGKVKKAAHKIIDQFSGVYRFAPVTGGFGVSGLFDEVLCVNGRFIGIEYKATSKQLPTTLQIGNAIRCISAGGCVLLIHDKNLEQINIAIMRAKTGLMPDSVWRQSPIPEVETQ